VQSNFLLLAGVVIVRADRDYFRRRASQEIIAAETAEHPEAQAVHYELAEHYLALASWIKAYSHRTRGPREKRSRSHF
jgi:hypothetical protein